MQKLFEALAAELSAGRPATLCTVIESHGSAPRGAGAKMALFQSGEAMGTIGGGIMEHLAEAEGREALSEGRSLVQAFSLSANDAASIGMICGGSVQVFFQHCAPDMAPLFAAIAKALSGDGDTWLALQGNAEGWRAGLYAADQTPLFGETFPPDLLQGRLGSQPALFAQEGESFLFIEPLNRSGFVYVFGGGHVSQELVPVLAHLDFRPVVFEDRPQFARVELFPGVARTILGDFAAFGEHVQPRRQDYIVIMTRGHAADHEVLAQALQSPAQYVGLIGSRTKFAATCEKLRGAGFGEEDIARIHNPIGLPILAETPAEIAISIASELIEHRARHARV
ncbi:MAG: XdhC family protein [Candidatus Pelethousia sp.]|nr:XdhC family protein [Candidatus Pelethousia sp.]